MQRLSIALLALLLAALSTPADAYTRGYYRARSTVEWTGRGYSRSTFDYMGLRNGLTSPVRFTPARWNRRSR